MISKKEALVLGAVAIAGTGVGLMILKGKEEEEAGEIPKAKKEMLIRYEAPTYAPSEVYAPYEERTITDIVHNVITNIFAPEPAPTPVPTPPPIRDYPGLTPSQAGELSKLGITPIQWKEAPHITPGSGETVTPTFYPVSKKDNNKTGPYATVRDPETGEITRVY